MKIIEIGRPNFNKYMYNLNFECDKLQAKAEKIQTSFKGFMVTNTFN